MTVLHFAVGGGKYGLHGLGNAPSPCALLVSYAYRQQFFDTFRGHVPMRHWILDSGAFTAHTGGKHVELSEYVDFCHAQLEADPDLRAVFGLDVIGDHEATMRNVEEMHRQGVPAIPTVHMSAPREAIEEAARYPKVALGGMVGASINRQRAFCEQAFAMLLPKWLHAFGVATERLLLRFPFASCDASTWCLAPRAYGRFRGYSRTGAQRAVPHKGKASGTGPDVGYHLKLEKRLASYWAPTLQEVQETL